MDSPRAGFEFVGVLANVDSTIMGVRFSSGTRVESHDVMDAARFLAELVNGHPYAIRGSLFIASCINAAEQRVYFVRRKYGRGALADSPESARPSGTTDTSLVVLSEKLRLARLFKKGNLQMPLQYGYTEDGGRRTLAMSGGSMLPIPVEEFSLSSDETDTLNEFLSASRLPFSRPYLDLAFRAFESSFAPLGNGLAFLALSSGLEALVNPSDHEIRYRISRNIAMLLSKSPDEFQLRSKRMKQLYDKRSQFIHGGDETAISREDVVELREIVRNSILRVNELDVDKETLMASLEISGFPFQLVHENHR